MTIPQIIFLIIILLFAGINIVAIIAWIVLWIRDNLKEKSEVIKLKSDTKPLNTYDNK